MRLVRVLDYNSLFQTKGMCIVSAWNRGSSHQSLKPEAVQTSLIPTRAYKGSAPGPGRRHLSLLRMRKLSVAASFLALAISQTSPMPTPGSEPMRVICCDECSDSHACQISFDGNASGFRVNCKGLFVEILLCGGKSNVAIESLRFGRVVLKGDILNSGRER
jgi:hypothetical protein